MHAMKIKEAGADRLFTIVNYCVLTLVMLIVLYPLVYVVSTSFSSSSAVLSGRVWLWLRSNRRWMATGPCSKTRWSCAAS